MPPYKGGVRRLGKELWRRTKEPINHATFLIYFIGIVVVIGGIGIWLEVIKAYRADTAVELSELRSAVASFFPALFGSTCAQVIIGKYIKSMKALAHIASISFMLLAIWLIFDDGLSTVTALLVGGLATIFAYWFWWVANADNPDLQDETELDAPVGGDPNRPLGGNLNEFVA